MDKNKLFISSIASNAKDNALKYGLGLEICEFATADNMDLNYEEYSKIVNDNIKGIDNICFHGPFNELFPSAIDTKVRNLTMERFKQGYELALQYDAKKIIFHSGYYSNMYYHSWFKEKSIEFWKEFMKSVSGNLIVCIENVFDNDPDVLNDIIDSVNNPNLKLCLDIGHVNTYTDISVVEWIKRCNTRISHFHIHNNDGHIDNHRSINNGTIDIKEVLDTILEYCKDATITIESIESNESIEWLERNGYLNE